MHMHMHTSQVRRRRSSHAHAHAHLADAATSQLAQNREAIDDAFASDDIGTIMSRLEGMEGEFASTTRATLGRMCAASQP